MSIRNAAPQDVEEIIRIEAVCFPPAEAAQPDDVRARYAAFPENFFVYEQDGNIAGFINGCTTRMDKKKARRSALFQIAGEPAEIFRAVKRAFEPPLR